MRTIDLEQTLSIIANIGVIAGIVFLRLELQQDNQLLGALARDIENAYLALVELLSTSV